MSIFIFHQSKLFRNILILVFAGSFSIACSEKRPSLFKQISPSKSGIDFSNQIQETQDFNILNFHYIYNGGGVGIGDFDKNGLADLVFSGNQTNSKIFLNKGQFKFKEIPQSANFNPEGWNTGVSILDINGDGWDDIYLSTGGIQCDGNCTNQLFVHQGLDENKNPIFKEMAEQYGLADGLYTQQCLFFDYDLDGDLDAYLLHNAIDKRDKNAPSQKHFINIKSKDQLLENNGLGYFVDRSDSLGIIHRGYGLGISINDFNEDGWPDLYIANDFLSDDLLYINQGKKGNKHLGFKESAAKYLKHTSYNAMGVEVADINNDALADILVLDMMPENNERQKSMLGFMNYNKFLLSLRQGYSPQFIRNTLQIHNGFSNGALLPFSEVAYLAGIYHTDWSWTPLAADFDNDGDKDLFMSNGYGKDITDLDFMNYSQTRSPFGNKESQQKKLFDVVQAMESITLPNYIFENQGELQFQNQQDNWIPKEKSISNGAVYADLDNDGDLDLIVNNINEQAFLMENLSDKLKANNYLQIKLEGSSQNPIGIGSKLQIWSNNQTQIQYQAPVRGYLSSVDPIIHFGLGKAPKIDSLKITWPNRKIQILQNVSANQLLKLDQSEAYDEKAKTKVFPEALFNTIDILKPYLHKESIYQDFNTQPLLLNQHSRQGPCLAAANLDGIPGDELFVGGAKGFPAQLYHLNTPVSLFTTLPEQNHEDTDACFFDFDLDGDLDLYIVSGSVEFKPDASEYEDRFLLNNGKGKFTQKQLSLPSSSGACVRPCDYDKDGDIDLFVGARIVPGKYPLAPSSHLLNNQKGEDFDILETPSLGMISDAIWTDYNNDGWDDLMLIGEWMPITIIKNNKGALDFSAPLIIAHSTGLWSSIAKGDFDKDGDEDFLLGNLGENSRFQASASHPLLLYKEDWDKNGSLDPFIGQYYLNSNGNKAYYPIHTRDDIIKQVPSIKNRYIKYATFGAATFFEILQEDLNSPSFLKAELLSSIYLENLGNDAFKKHKLPDAAQLAPIQDILVGDFNEDGLLDALLSGNDFSSEKNNGWYDAFNGLLIQGMNKGTFEPVNHQQSGFIITGDGRDILQINGPDTEKLIIVGQNKGPISIFTRH